MKSGERFSLDTLVISSAEKLAFSTFITSSSNKKRFCSIFPSSNKDKISTFASLNAIFFPGNLLLTVIFLKFA